MKIIPTKRELRKQEKEMIIRKQKKEAHKVEEK